MWIFIFVLQYNYFIINFYHNSRQKESFMIRALDHTLHNIFHRNCRFSYYFTFHMRMFCDLWSTKSWSRFITIPSSYLYIIAKPFKNDQVSQTGRNRCVRTQSTVCCDNISLENCRPVLGTFWVGTSLGQSVTPWWLLLAPAWSERTPISLIPSPTVLLRWHIGSVVILETCDGSYQSNSAHFLWRFSRLHRHLSHRCFLWHHSRQMYSIGKTHLEWLSLHSCLLSSHVYHGTSCCIELSTINWKQTRERRNETLSTTKN